VSEMSFQGHSRSSQNHM